MPDYDFRALSPIDFEVFTRDLLNAELGLNLTSFAVGPDGGIDLRDSKNGEITIAQCKHRPEMKKPDIIKSAKKEILRWQPSDMSLYIFIASCAVSPDTEKDVLDTLSPLPITENSFWHRGILNSTLSRHKNVERDHFKLWLSTAHALEEITAASQWQRSEQLLQRVSERIKLYVHTPAYAAATKVLEKENLVMISGAPGVGKSTLAEMILLSLWHEGWTVVNIASDIDEAWRQIKTDQDKVVFYYDDFLGQTSSAELQKNEGSGVALLIDKIRRGNGNHLLVLTTREQILRNAGNGDDDRVRRLSEDHSKLRIELGEIKRSTRAQMLFNHLHFGFKDAESRKVLSSDIRYRRVIDHPGFNPRILESIAISQKFSDVDGFYAAMFEALDHPESIWAGSFQQLSKTAVQILFQLAVWPKGLMSLEDIRLAVKPDDPREWKPALKVLENTWIRLSGTADVIMYVSLFDPSRRDFLLDLLSESVYFDAILEDISFVQQVTYIYRLAGLIQSTESKSKDLKRPLLKKAAENRVPDLDSLIVRLVMNELKTISRLEDLTAKQNEDARRENYRLRIAHEKDKKLRPDWKSFVIENYYDRIQLLSELSIVCFSIDAAMQESESLLKSELVKLEILLDERCSPDASSLFLLAAGISSDERSQWYLDYATRILKVAFDNISESETLNDYSLLPYSFREGPFKEEGKKMLQDALDRELDALGQQNDREMMTQWLDDLEFVATEHDVPFYSDGMRQTIEEMEEPPFRESNSFSSSKVNFFEDGESNSELDQLFSKLNS